MQAFSQSLKDHGFDGGYSYSVNNAPQNESEYNAIINAPQGSNDDRIYVYHHGESVSPSLLPTYSDIQTIIGDWTDSITLVNNSIEIAAGSFPTNPTIRVDINDFDNMPEYISLDRVGSEPNEDPGSIDYNNDNLTFYSSEGLSDHLYASAAFTGPTFVDGRLTYVVDGAVYSEPHSFRITPSADLVALS